MPHAAFCRRTVNGLIHRSIANFRFLFVLVLRDCKVVTSPFILAQRWDTYASEAQYEIAWRMILDEVIKHPAVQELVLRHWREVGHESERVALFVSLPKEDLHRKRMTLLDALALAVTEAGFELELRDYGWLYIHGAFHQIRFRVSEHHRTMKSDNYPYHTTVPTANLQLDFNYTSIAREPEKDLASQAPRLVNLIRKNWDKHEIARLKSERISAQTAAWRAERASHANLMQAQKETFEKFELMVENHRRASELRSFLSILKETSSPGHNRDDLISFLEVRARYFDPLTDGADAALDQLAAVFRRKE